VNPDTSIFHIARKTHPLKAVRRAAAAEAKAQIRRLQALDLRKKTSSTARLVDRWLETLRRHAAEPR
jgi:hypothetical protein